MSVSTSVLATATSTAGGFNLAIAAVTAAVGDFLVACVGMDNNNASGSSSIGTITDSAGNTWTKRGETNYTPGAVAGDGCTVALFDCLVSNALSSGTVTVNTLTGVPSKCATIWKVNKTEREFIRFESIGAGVTGNGTSVSTGAFSVGADRVIFGAMAIEASGLFFTADTDTTAGSWSAASDLSANTGTLASSMRCYSQSKVTDASASQTWNPVLSVARDYALNYAVYEVVQQITFASATGTGTATGLVKTRAYARAEATGTGSAEADRGARVSGVAETTGFGYATGFYPYSQASFSIEGTKYWQGFPGPAGYLDIPAFGLFPIDIGVDPLAIRTTRGNAYLLRVTLPTEGAIEDYEVLYPAASFGRSTEPTDVPANQHVPGLLLGSTINYSISLFGGIEPTAASSGGSGAIVLLDPTGLLDDLVNRSWDGATLDILQGDPRKKFNTFNIAGRLTTAGILYDQRRKEIRVRDQAWKLEQGRIHDDVYDGEGDLGGDPELKGQYRPIGFGLCRNIEPRLINSVRQIRQLSNGPIRSVLEVRDGGAVIAFSGLDYPSYEALAAAADASLIPEGTYSTSLADGLLATGSIPVFQLTCDMEGDALEIDGVGYVDRIAPIVRRVAVGRGNVRLSSSDIDFASLNKLDQEQPDVSGWWFPGGSDMITKAQAIQEMMNGRLGWWAVRLNGLLAFGVMDVPEGNPVMVIDYPADFAGEPAQLDTYQVPRHSTFLGYRRNYTVQDASSQAGSIVGSPESIIYSQESQFQGVTSSVPLWRVPTAQDIRIFSGLDDPTATLSEATRQQAIMGVRRERWTIPVPCDPFSDLLGRVIEIRNFPRYGWGSSRKFIVIGQSFATGIAVQLTLWG